MLRLKAFIAAVVAASLSACAAGPDYRHPDIQLPASYINGGAIVAADKTADEWWRGFKDPVLDRVIDRTLAQNLDLAQVSARMDQARAAAREAGSALAPRLDLNASSSRVHSSLKSPIGEVANAVGAPRNYDDYSVGAQASWEIDLFGGLRRGRDAAKADAQAAEVGVAAMRISIAAEAADAYLALRGLQTRLAVAEEQQQTQTDLVQLIRQRADQGLAANRELQLATGDLEGVRAAIAPLHAAIDGQLNRLDVLMGAPAGTYRAELTAVEVLPVAPSPSGSVTPADLLRHRPDVTAAERRLAASSSRIGAAIAEYYPHVSLGGLLGLASVSTGSLISSDALQAAGIAGLRWRLFDFGRVDAEVAIAKGREAEALAAYRATAIRATEDVETALSIFLRSREETMALERQIASLKTARSQTQDAYQQGALSLLEVLDIDRQLLAASDRLAIARTNTARASVASFRALGGGWSGAPALTEIAQQR